MSNGEIVNIVKKYGEGLRKNGIDFQALYLFGSYAKGNNKDWSDIDVAVVSDYLDDKYDEGRFLLWKLTRAVDLRIEPHGFALSAWNDPNNPMAHEIKSTGLKVA
ncbi:nucleotidyltransferase domain-containing protein [Patescibacteria group bacterium]|nr:nucleotidyltransferase domain-containing protein [Patescibacteria group bacterium]MDE1946836.1 nucleotidyltransferase domain-containing protein [Patescibacteria group bacterium]MDE2010656.1 nucleotidyltransferase domain-containing protein [Patescibacteria group bacterium]MDE2232738.1 nucleotidyltransferase domain-containing protein [Patescibacteria group bacterium]